MKKFTLALSAMLMTASSALAIQSGSYVVVPADETTQATGKFLSVNASGSLALSNELNDASKWEVVYGEMDENFNIPHYLTNGDKYMTLGEDGVTMGATPSMTFVQTYWDVDGAYTISNHTNMWYPPMTHQPLYVNALNLGTDPESSDNSAFYFLEYNEGMTVADVENALWKIKHPEAMVIAVGGESARARGKYMAVTAEGRLITTNTLNENAVWEKGYDEELEAEVITNLAVKGYLYEGNASRNITLSATPKPISLVASEKIIGAYGITTDMEADASTSGAFLNALNTSANGEDGGIGTWNLDAGSSFFTLAWDPSVTAADIDSQVDELIPLGMAKVTAIAEVSKYMNVSAWGRNYGESDIIAVENAETAEELAENKAMAIQQAINYAESTMAEGFVLKSSRTNMFVSQVENVQKPIVQTGNADLNSIWYAVEVNAPEAVAEGEYAFKTFVLRNGLTNKYVGKCSQYSGVTPVADDEASAATLTLELGERGFVIREINSSIAGNAYLNVSDNPDAPELTVWVDANDDGAYFTFDEMPTLSDEQAWVSFVGETVPNEYMGGVDYTSLSAIEICLPAEEAAKATGNGEIVVYKLDYDPETYQSIRTDIATIAGTTLKDAKPELRKVGRTYRDNFTWEMITDSVMAATFTVQLPETVTEPGSVYVDVDKFMFKVPVDGADVLSGAMSNSVEVVTPPVLMPVAVTPNAGDVESLSAIVIDPNGTQGWYAPDLATAEGNLTVTFDGAIASDAEGRPIDVTGAEMERYYVFDEAAEIFGGWHINVNFTEAGTYKLTIPEGFLMDQEHNSNELTEVEWVIKEQDGIAEISEVKVNGKVIYDLSGRRVNKATRGLYVVDGVKTLVK